MDSEVASIAPIMVHQIIKQETYVNDHFDPDFLAYALRHSMSILSK